MFCRVVEREGALLGFALCVLHEASWVVQPVCYLEDLFVCDTLRGQGIGRALIEDVIGLARLNGWARLYWHTNGDNLAARCLYDQFIQADGFVRYRLVLD